MCLASGVRPLSIYSLGFNCALALLGEVAGRPRDTDKDKDVDKLDLDLDLELTDFERPDLELDLEERAPTTDLDLDREIDLAKVLEDFETEHDLGAGYSE
ncbi:hypothetical protein TorRG33x02_068540 [Trema orientale]|uniref:Uncharacterized protein n=1 Tax=Trema orientale TaxID=63057 RepID=A0A2P5FI04_TREOI|nr:hypothetical protein TorRG33x02_068540 [Trema orientale]